jgi:hypothetical protein
VISFGRFYSDDIEVGQRAIAEVSSDAFGDLTSKPQGGVIGFALSVCVLVFSMFQTRVDPVTFSQLGDQSLGFFDPSKRRILGALGHSLIQIGGLDRRKGTAPSSSVLARDSQRLFGSGCVAGCRVFSCLSHFC